MTAIYDDDFEQELDKYRRDNYTPLYDDRD